MNSTEYIAIGSLFIALVSLITGFILQRDQKKIREVERINKKYKSRLSKSLKAIKGYQFIEEKQAKALSKDTAIYRREIRRDYADYFNSDFVTPKNINELIQELENE